VNGVDVQFTNCDQRPNSQITLFGRSRSPSTYAYNVQFPLCNQFFSSLASSQQVIPARYFSFMETHFGGPSCGCFSQTDGRVSIDNIVSAGIGFK